MSKITEATKDMTYEEKLLVYRMLQELHAARNDLHAVRLDAKAS